MVDLAKFLHCFCIICTAQSDVDKKEGIALFFYPRKTFCREANRALPEAAHSCKT